MFEQLKYFLEDPVRGSKYFAQRALLGLFDKEARKLCGSAGEYLIKPMENWPQFKADVAVAMGEGTTTKEVVNALLELAKQELLPRKVIFTGGRKMQDTEFAWRLNRELGNNPLLRKHKGITESRFGALAFIEGLEAAGIKSDQYNIIDAGGGKHADANLAAAVATGQLLSHRSIAFVGLPYSLARIMTTWKRVVEKLKAGKAERAALTFIPAWPYSLGITPDNWRNNLIARRVVVDESRKIKRYEKAGHCVPFTPELVANERRRAEAFKSAP